MTIVTNTVISQAEVDAIRSVQNKLYSQAFLSGWHSKPREDGTAIALMHSELSEALEYVRKGGNDDHLPNRPGVEVELADTIIRILDFAGKHGYDVAGAIAEKNDYNGRREDHKLENRAKDGGKKF